MNAGEIVRQVSFDLNDQESGYGFTTWPEHMLMAWLHEALVNLSQEFKHLYTKRKVVQVELGGDWQNACDCDVIERIVGEVTEDGQQIIRKLVRLADTEEYTWAGGASSCPLRSPSDYRMFGYQLSEIDPSMFRIVPELPRGGKPHYILLECFMGVPSVNTATAVPWQMVPMVKQWMLGRALAVDSENNQTAAQLSGQHFELYNQLLKQELLRRQMEKKDEQPDNRVRPAQNDSAK